MKKRILAILLALAMVLSFAACAPSGSEGKGSGDAATSGKVLEQDEVLKIAIPSDVSWPYNENWPIWKYIREAIGGTLEVTAIPSTEFRTKLALMLTQPETLPDLTYVWSKSDVDNHAGSGAFIAVDDYIDVMPNYQAFWHTVEEETRNELFKFRKYGDGKTYSPQVHGVTPFQTHNCWMYRKDVFEKHGLEVPETWGEMYEICKTLKSLYPNSYPLNLAGIDAFSAAASTWKPYMNVYVAYDPDTDVWSWGSADPVMKELVEFMCKLREEGLIAPDFFSMSVKDWEKHMSTDLSFIGFNTVSRIDIVNNAAQTLNPEFVVDFMAPPRGETETGVQGLPSYMNSPEGYVAFNTGDEKRIENAMQYIDWFYTDEACDIVSWGKEGETYEVIDGERKFLIDEGEAVQTAFGVYTYGTYMRLDPEMGREYQSERQNKAIEETLKYEEKTANPKRWLPFLDDEIAARDEYRLPLESYTEEMISKFLNGQTPISEWDNFQKGLKEMGVDEVLKMYKDAYDRINK